MTSVIIFKIQINFLLCSKISILKMKFISVTGPRGKHVCLQEVFTCLGTPYFAFLFLSQDKMFTIHLQQKQIFLSLPHTHTHTHTLRVYVIYKLQEKMVICSLPSHLRGRKKNAYLFGLLHNLCRSHFFSSMPLRVLLRRGCKPVRMITKSAYYFRHVRPSICPHTSARLPLDGFP